MQVNIVIGPILSGKSTFINSRFTTKDAVIVRIGKFLRESIGLEAMAKDPSPNVCNVTESWVRSHVKGAIGCAIGLRRPIVFDGYPRSVDQVDFLHEVLLPIRQTRHVSVTAHYLTVNHLELVRRVDERAKGDLEAAAFDRLRLSPSIEGVEKVMDHLQRRFRDINIEVIPHIPFVEA